MTKRPKTPQQRAQRAAGDFMLKVGQIGRATESHNLSGFLFPLWMHMDCWGILACDVLTAYRDRFRGQHPGDRHHGYQERRR